MKKEWTVKLGLLALILTLVTTSLVSGTFAMYTSQVSGYDTARVAKFEYSIKDGEGVVFGKDTRINIFETSDMAVKHLMDGDKKADELLIAPGTSGSFKIEIENNSEVAVEVDFELTETNLAGIPVYYTFGGNKYTGCVALLSDETDDETYYTIVELAEALKVARLNYVNDGDDDKLTHKIDWAWDFERDDAYDTDLGEVGADIIQLEIECTVTQLKE